MKNITVYILLICAVTIINSAKHEKKVIKKKLPKLTDENLEEEARRDIEKLLKDSKPYNDDDDDDDDEYKYDDDLPTRTYSSSKTRSQINNNAWLIGQIIKLINNQDLSIPRKDINRDTERDGKSLLFNYPHSWGKRKPALRSRYHQLMRHLATTHGNAIKQRLDTKIKEDDLSLIRKDNQHQKLMKSLELKHRGVIKERYADEFGKYRDALRMRPDDEVTRQFAKKRKVKHTLPVARTSRQSKMHPATNNKIKSPSEDDTDISFSDLLNGKYLRQRINEWDGKKHFEGKFKSNFDDDVDIDRALRKGNRFNDKPDPHDKMSSRLRSNKPRLFENRFRRAAFTQAGYTQDPDICKTYNENLMKLWANLSKLINVTEQPNERALHNIAIMIQAYLDHQNAKPTTESYKAKPEPPRDRVGDVIFKIKKMLDDDEANSERVSRTIIKNLKPFYEDAENTECQQVNEESLTSSVDLLYRNYMENVECRNEDDGSSLNLRKRGGKNIQTLSGKWQNTNDDDKPEIKSILIEDELYKEISKGHMSRQRPPSKFRRIFKQSKNAKSSSFLSRSTGQNMNASDKPKVRTRLNKPIAKKLRKSLLKTDMDKSKCEKYAIRKFTMSLRPVIDRFMALFECQLDNTLRSLNYDRVVKDPYYLYSSKYQSNENSQQQKSSLRQMTRKNTGQIADHVTRKSQTQNRYELSNENDNSLFEQTDEYSYSKQISAEQITGTNYMSSVLDSFKLSNTDDKNEFDTKYNDNFQTPPKYNDYDGTLKTRSDNTNNSFKSQFKLDQSNDNTSRNKNADSSGKDKVDENLREISLNMIFEENDPKTSFLSMNEDKALRLTENKNEMDNKNAEGSDTEKPNLRNDDRFTYGSLDQNQEAAKSYESIKDFLKNARDASLKTPEFAVPFALDSNKGYVELTHLVKYPKIIVYRPQFIVKNTMPYDDFLKTINNINMTNDEVRLMKIVRHLPDNTVKVLFETEDFEAPLEVRNFKQTRRWGLPMTFINDILASRTVEMKQSDKSSDTDDDKDFNISVDVDSANSNIVDEKLGSDKTVSSEKAIERQLPLNSDTNPTLDSDPKAPVESSDGIVLVPRTASGLLSKISSGISSGITSGLSSGIVSSISSTIGSGIDSTKNLVSSLNPIQSIKSNSFINKFLPSFSDSQSIPPLDANLDPYYSSNSENQLHSEHYTHSQDSHSNIQYTSEPIVPKTEYEYNSSELENVSPSSELSYFNEWWKTWKLLLLNRIKKIIGRMTSLADNIDHIVKI